MEIPKTPGFENLTGKKFGRLTVLYYYGPMSPNKRTKQHAWVCQCECGTQKIIRGPGLKSGKTQSCGCLHKEKTSKARLIDLTGQIFGRLTVINCSDQKIGGELLWHCQCECGNSKLIRGVSLRHGHAKSCGCRQGKFTHGLWSKPGYKKLYLSDPVRKIRHSVSTAIRGALIQRGGSKRGQSVFDYLPYTIDELKKHIESQFEEWMTWDNYGGLNSSKEKTWHVDHIKPQSSFSFVSMDEPQFLECWSLSNLRPLEKIANITKGCRYG